MNDLRPRLTVTLHSRRGGDVEKYPPIEDHGMIGDLQTAALIARDGTLDWFCAPRFDSPSIFAGLLDRKRGGYFSIVPDGIRYLSKQLYFPGTPILITRFISADGVGEIIDFMPVAGEQATDQRRLVRITSVVRGSMRFRMACRPRFDYGRDRHELDSGPEGSVFRAASMTLTLHVSLSTERLARESDLEKRDGDLFALSTLHQGERAAVILETASVERPHFVPFGEVDRMFAQTRDYWRGWIDRSEYTGRWRETVERSAITLKLMTYAPTGAMVAAPTASLPERIGGSRNWDYRYTWIRDASFSVTALLALGFTDEARRYVDWLDERIREAGDNAVPLKVMYRVDGSSDLNEEILDHFEGYRGSGPVRIGNGAANQLQLDIHGEALDALHLADMRGIPPSHQIWRSIVSLVNWLCDNWDRPDDSMWERRGNSHDHTYGRLMCWVALDRAIRLADRHGRPADRGRWSRERNTIYNQIMEHGYHPSRRSFVQSYGHNLLDASLLLMPIVGFVTASDPMWQSTLRAIDNELVSDSLVYRYDPVASPDGLPGSEGTFNMCTFWYAEALARSNRLDDARLTFEKMLTFSNHLGLYAEEIAPSGEQIGNFPQGFSHLALIKAAAVLDQCLDRRKM